MLNTEARLFHYNTSWTRSLLCSQPFHSPQRRDHGLHSGLQGPTSSACLHPIVVPWPHLLFSPWSLHPTLSAVLPASWGCFVLVFLQPIMCVLRYLEGRACSFTFLRSFLKDSSKVYPDHPVQAAASLTAHPGTPAPFL